jgi:DNA-binding response OmpR family regulator
MPEAILIVEDEPALQETLIYNLEKQGYIGDSRTVDVHVRRLRQKIEKNAASPTRIVTVRGGGYRFEG